MPYGWHWAADVLEVRSLRRGSAGHPPRPSRSAGCRRRSALHSSLVCRGSTRVARGQNCVAWLRQRRVPIRFDSAGGITRRLCRRFGHVSWSGGGHSVVASPWSDGLRVQRLDSADPHRDRHGGVAGGRDHGQSPWGHRVASERVANREQRGVDPPSHRHTAWPMVEPAWSLDLRCHRCGLGRLEACHSRRQRTYLQPLQHRAGAVLRAARLESRQPARPVVGQTRLGSRTGTGHHCYRRPCDCVPAWHAPSRRRVSG